MGRLGPSIHEDFVKAGVCFDTQEFVGRAAQAQHPLQAPQVLSPSSTKVIFDSATKGPKWVIKQRAMALKKYLDLDKDFRDEEASLHAQLYPSVQKVVRGKRILLFKKCSGTSVLTTKRYRV